MLKTKATQNEFSSPNNSCNDKDHLVFFKVNTLEEGWRRVQPKCIKATEKN